MAAKSGGKAIFFEKSPLDPEDTLRVQYFVKIDLAPFSKINALLRFTQKFKMAAKSGGKAIFFLESPVDSSYTLRAKKFVEIAHLSPFQDNSLYVSCRNSRWPPKVVGK